MLLAIILIGSAMLAYFKPTFAVGLILTLLPTYLIRYEFHNIPTTFLELLLGVFLIVILIKNFNDIPDLKHLGILNWFILAFVVAGIISTAVSPDKRAALGVLKAFIIEPVLFFYACRLVIKKQPDLTTPLNLLFLGGILISLFGVFQYYTFIHLPLKFWGTGEEVERITSFFDYPNALALYLAPLCSFFFAGFLFGGKVLNRKNLIIGLAIMLFALILTFSRGAWLGFGVATFLILAIRYPIKKVLIAGLILMALIFVIPQTRNRLFLSTHDASSAARVSLGSAAFTKIKQSPILGNGLFGFRTTLMQQGFTGEILNYPHNIFFNFWVEMGLLGLISFFGVMFIAAKNYKTNHNWYVIGAMAFLFTLVIHGLVDVPYFKNDLSILFWFIISVFYV